jgi:ABC-2 type transport system permease protein
MTTAITRLAPPARTRRPSGDALKFEWTKLRTLRSTWSILAAVVAVTIGVGIIVSSATVADWNNLTGAERTALDTTFRSLTGLFFGQLVVGVLGVLAVTSEYATGMIRSTLAAIPHRRLVLAAKAVAVAVPVFVASTVACLVAFLAGQAIFATKHAGVSLFAPGELRAVIGGGLLLTVLALLAVGLGGIVRRTAGAITTFAGLVLVLPTLVGFLPNPWGRDISKFLPSDAGQSLLNLHGNANTLSPWTGFAVLCAWAALALGGAAWLMTHRDA